MAIEDTAPIVVAATAGPARRSAPPPGFFHSPVCRMSIMLDAEGNAIILHELKKGG